MLEEETETKESFNWPVLLVITLGGVTAGIYRNGIMTILPFLKAEYNLTRAQAGLYSTFLYLSSVIVAAFAGRIADQWGVKKSMFWGLCGMGLFIFMHVLAPNFVFILLFATLTGLGLSIILPTASKGISEWFSDRNQATAMGIMTLGFSLGGVLGASLLPSGASYFGWKISVVLLGSVYFLVSLLFSFLYSDKDSESDIDNDSKIEEKEGAENSFVEDIFILFKSKYLVTLCLLGIMFGVASGIVVTHFTLYLFLEFDFTEVTAGLGFMILQIGSMVGRPGWGLLNDKLFRGKEKIGFAVLGVCIGIISLAFAFLNNYSPSLFLILFLGFMLGGTGRGWQGLYFSAVSEQVGEEKTGIGTGLSLVFVRIGIILGPPVFGFIADRAGSYSYSWLLLAIFTFGATIIGNYFLVKYQDA